MTDDDFVAAIRAAGGDRTPRLAYADWLEERADRRFELIRAVEAMRELPPFADDYWRLKARRAELAAAVDPAWATAVGLDPVADPPLFRFGVPADVRGRWRLLRAFVEVWHGIPMPDGGGHADVVGEAERRIGRPLPPSLCEWAAFCEDLPDYRYELVFPEFEWCGLVDRGNHPVYAVSVQNDGRGEVFWWVLGTDLTSPDPPVYMVFDEHQELSPERLAEGPDHPTTSQFAFQQLLTGLWQPSSKLNWPTEPAEYAAWLDRLAAEYLVRARFDQREVFEDADAIVVDDDSAPPHLVRGACRFPRRR